MFCHYDVIDYEEICKLNNFTMDFIKDNNSKNWDTWDDF